MNTWILYLLYHYNKLYHLLMFASVIGISWCIVFRGLKFTNTLKHEYTNEARTELKKLKRSIYFAFVIIFITLTIPNRNYLLLMWGFSKVMNDKTAMDLSHNSWKRLDAYLDNRIKELNKELADIK